MAEQEKQVKRSETLAVTNAHSLQLYSSSMDKHAIQAAFFSGTAEGEKTFYITQEDKSSAKNLFAECGVSGVTILSPTELAVLENQSGGRILVDFGSCSNAPLLEKKVSEIKGNNVLCTYDLSRVDPNKIKGLVELHGKLILSTPESTVISYASLHGLSDGVVEKLIRNDLETIVLALISGKPMSGMDLIKFLHKEFDVMVSPGKIYPVLHDLAKKGLLSYEYEIKNKVYKVRNVDEVRHKLTQHAHASRFLSKFLERGVAQAVKP